MCGERVRGLEREKPGANCMFCQGVVKELERDDIPSAKPLYRYTCSACDKIFIAEHANTCISCGGRFLHFYEVTKLSTREILSMRKRQLKERIKSIKKNIKKKRGK